MPHNLMGFFVLTLWAIVALLTENLHKKTQNGQVDIQVVAKSPNRKSVVNVTKVTVIYLSSRVQYALHTSLLWRIIMKANVGGIDRVLRILVGLALIGWVLLANGPIWAWIGVIPLVTGLIIFCPAYGILGINTCKTKE